MDYTKVAECYSVLEGISGRNELTRVLALLFKETPKSELGILVYLTQGKLRPDYEGVELGLAEKMALRAIAGASGLASEKVHRTYVKFGDIGTAAQKLLEGRAQDTLFSERLTLRRVHETLMKIARKAGSGSVEAKQSLLLSLLNDSTPLEAKYIMRTVTGGLRLGVADYTVIDAAALAFLGDKEDRAKVERAYNVHPDLGFIVEELASGGVAAVEGVRVDVGVPIRPMLAERLESAKAIVDKMGGKTVAAEYKLDGERLQVHKSVAGVSLFSRRLEVITGHYPDAVELVKDTVSAKEAILEAEVVAIDEDTGDYLPFQELMHRRRKHGVDKAVADYPIALNFFDALFVGRSDLTLEPYSARRKKLEAVLKVTPRTRPVPRLTTSLPEEIEAFMEQAIQDGCEGLLVKDLDSPYRAGAREFAWIKLKREYRSELTDTLDLPIIGAFHGRGRRTGNYGTYLLGAHDTERGVFTSIGKVGTGFTDDDLTRIPKVLKSLESRVKPSNVESKMVPDAWFRPGVILEVIASELTLSPIHTAAKDRIRPGAGLSLRFPKFTGKIRDDKRPDDSTTVEELVSMYNRQLKKLGPVR
ncbi:MAG: ATP-dependent DNA ligase [Thaumarchaeota archaeon]|nr:ATP-dependent DNA ligase [Nitrososphaerota archaeon]